MNFNRIYNNTYIFDHINVVSILYPFFLISLKQLPSHKSILILIAQCDFVRGLITANKIQFCYTLLINQEFKQ